MRICYFVLACSVLAACANKAHSNDSHTDVSSASSTPPAQAIAADVKAAKPADSVNATAPLPANPRDIPSLFQTEAAARPTGTIRVEDAVAAFRKDGIQIDDVKQHLARPYGARYCVGTKLSNLVAISLCEYVDTTAAKAGVAVSQKIPLANREIQLNQATSLTVRDLEKTPAADALGQRLFASFAKLKTS